MIIILALASSLISGFICYYIARRRSGNYAFWAAMGIALGPLAIPFSFFARPRAG
jgi:hypothetical protein